MDGGITFSYRGALFFIKIKKQFTRTIILQQLLKQSLKPSIWTKNKIRSIVLIFFPIQYVDIELPNFRC